MIARKKDMDLLQAINAFGVCRVVDIEHRSEVGRTFVIKEEARHLQ